LIYIGPETKFRIYWKELIEKSLLTRLLIVSFLHNIMFEFRIESFLVDRILGLYFSAVLIGVSMIFYLNFFLRFDLNRFLDHSFLKFIRDFYIFEDEIVNIWLLFKNLLLLLIRERLLLISK